MEGKGKIRLRTQNSFNKEAMTSGAVAAGGYVPQRALNTDHQPSRVQLSPFLTFLAITHHKDLGCPTQVGRGSSCHHTAPSEELQRCVRVTSPGHPQEQPLLPAAAKGAAPLPRGYYY